MSAMSAAGGSRRARAQKTSLATDPQTIGDAQSRNEMSECLRRLDPVYSILTLAAWMIGVQRAISLLTKARNGCGPRFPLSGISQPRTNRRLRVASSSSALSSASTSLSRIGFGVALGANKPVQADAWNSGSPASTVVGTFGMIGLRSVDATA